MKRIPIWIDTDPGVDDAAAILVAHRSPALQIVGISTLAGNAPLGVTTHNALALCAFLGADYPVYCGAAQPWLRPYLCGADFHGADGMGGYRLPEPTREAEKAADVGRASRRRRGFRGAADRRHARPADEPCHGVREIPRPSAEARPRRDDGRRGRRRQPHALRRI